MKNWKMGLGLGFVASAMLAIVACSSSSSGGGGGGFSCSSKGNCPNDVAPTQMSIDSCNKAQQDPNCGAKFTTLANCLYANVTCGTDGKSTVDQSKCQNETSAYTSCVLGSFDAGVGGG